jgi:hypothetical protein
MQIREVLNQQTLSQFRQYAQQQFPNMVDKQDILIQQLQEQHFQQYMQQVYQQHMAQQQQQMLLQQQQQLSTVSSSSPIKTQQEGSSSTDSTPVHVATNGVTSITRTGSESGAGATDKGTLVATKKVTLNGTVPNGHHVNGGAHDTAGEAVGEDTENDDSDNEGEGQCKDFVILILQSLQLRKMN